MILNLVILIIGLGILTISADMLIESSVKIAKKLKISKLVVSLTIVALGTSIPECVVSIMSAIKGSPIAFANVVGSNIANIALIIGVSLLIGGIVISKEMKKEIVKMLILKFIFLILVFVGYTLSYIDGIIFLLLLLYYVYDLYKLSRNDKELEESDEAEEWIYKLGIKIFKKEGLLIFSFMFAGILGLIYGGQLVVNSAINIAKVLNINEGIIGATIVAVGTSLPELMTCIVAMKKKHYEIVIGNIVGSNVINILLILGISSILTPIAITSFEILQVVLMTIVTLVFSLFALLKGKLNKLEGIILLALFILSCLAISFV